MIATFASCSSSCVPAMSKNQILQHLPCSQVTYKKKSFHPVIQDSDVISWAFMI